MGLAVLNLFLIFSFPALSAEKATLHDYRFQQKVFETDARLACQIKRFTLINTHQEIKDQSGTGTDHFTSMAAVIDTTGPSCIRKYGVVQFIQGCVSNQEYNKQTGDLSPKHFGTVRTSREKNVYFSHPHFEVDSLNLDPLYSSKSSSDTGERQGWYYVSKKTLRLKNNRDDILADDYLFQRPSSRHFLENSPHETTQVYVADLPSQAGFHSDPRFTKALITTPSLDFKTCVYDLKDIPAQGEPEPPETPHAVGGPLLCFDWSHKFEFDLDKANFRAVTQAGTDPFCQNPVPNPGKKSESKGMAASPTQI